MAKVTVVNPNPAVKVGLAVARSPGRAQSSPCNFEDRCVRYPHDPISRVDVNR